MRRSSMERAETRGSVQFSNSRRVSLCLTSIDTRDCRLLIAVAVVVEVGFGQRSHSHLRGSHQLSCLSSPPRVHLPPKNKSRAPLLQATKITAWTRFITGSSRIATVFLAVQFASLLSPFGQTRARQSFHSLPFSDFAPCSGPCTQRSPSHLRSISSLVKTH